MTTDEASGLSKTAKNVILKGDCSLAHFQNCEKVGLQNFSNMLNPNCALQLVQCHLQVQHTSRPKLSTT